MKPLLFIAAMIVFSPCRGQYFQFSQYNFAPQRINPAAVADPTAAKLSMISRIQGTAGGFTLRSNIFNVAHPIAHRRAHTWSGVGLSILDDRAGSGIFKATEIGLSYAIAVPVAKNEFLSVGGKFVQLFQRVSLDGLYSGSQYVPDRGFVPEIDNGESGFASNRLSTFSAGGKWILLDKKGNTIRSLGISFFDFNTRPAKESTGLAKYPSTLFSTYSVKIADRNKIALFHEMVFTRSSRVNSFTPSVVTRFELPNPHQWFDVITRYAMGRSIIVAFQFTKNDFSFGFSYDFPAGKQVGNTGAVEGAIELRKKLSKKLWTKKSTRKKNSSEQAVSKNAKNNKTAQMDTISITGKSEQQQVEYNEMNLSARIKHKADSLRGVVEPGRLKNELLELEKQTLHFEFAFNSADVNEEAQVFFDDLANVLLENESVTITLVGHTDNVGSDEFNLKLSQSRANAIKRELIDRGVEGSRITCEGKGMREPVRENTSPEGRAANRRVELTIWLKK